MPRSNLVPKTAIFENVGIEQTFSSVAPSPLRIGRPNNLLPALQQFVRPDDVGVNRRLPQLDTWPD